MDIFNTSMTMNKFTELLRQNTESGFFNSYPFEYEEIVGIHNACLKAVAWESSLSFAAYHLYEWLEHWRNQNAKLCPIAQWLYKVWCDGAFTYGWNEASLTCWKRRPSRVLANSCPIKEGSYKVQWDKDLNEAMCIFNQFVELCRAVIHLCPVNQPVARQIQLANKNFKSCTQYLNNLRQRHSRLLVIRLDLFYKKEYRASKTINDLSRDRKAFMKNANRNPLFNHSLGYVWCFEVGNKKGLHCHLLIFYDSSHRAKDEWIGHQLGEHWQKTTNSRGAFYNVNTKASKERLRLWQAEQGYLQRLQEYFSELEAGEVFKQTAKQQQEGTNTLGIGVVHRTNAVSWANLGIQMRYFTKMDQAIPASIRQGSRCLGKGV